MGKLDGKKVAILATDGFEQSELLAPRKALLAEGAKVTIVSLKVGAIRGWKDTDWGDSVTAERTVAEAHADEFDALMLPGGVANPDTLRADARAVAFVDGFVKARKPIAAICHGPQTLIETGMVKGRRMTSYASLATDLKNAGATWVDEEVVVDDGLVTSRKPEDIPAFNAKMIEEFSKGVHARHARTNGSGSEDARPTASR